MRHLIPFITKKYLKLGSLKIFVSNIWLVGVLWWQSISGQKCQTGGMGKQLHKVKKSEFAENILKYKVKINFKKC